VLPSLLPLSASDAYIDDYASSTELFLASTLLWAFYYPVLPLTLLFPPTAVYRDFRSFERVLGRLLVALPPYEEDALFMSTSV